MYNTDLPTRAELPSSARLLRSTLVAAAVAGALLVTTVLPSEYGLDPTGVGRALGLTQMGEIKSSLKAEADASAEPVAKLAERAPVAPRSSDQGPAMAEARAAGPSSEPNAKQPVAAREDTVTVMLKPGAAAEVKLAMRKDSTVRYEWTSAGGPVNFDTHGDPINAPKSFYHGYAKRRNETADAGTLQAVFDGTHGWFWRNRSGAEVTITLKTSGEYDEIKRVL
jgi:hypothetical protein